MFVVRLHPSPPLLLVVVHVVVFVVGVYVLFPIPTAVQTVYNSDPKHERSFLRSILNPNVHFIICRDGVVPRYLVRTWYACRFEGGKLRCEIDKIIPNSSFATLV